MRISVYMLAFNGIDKIRIVDVPEDEVTRTIAKYNTESVRIPAVLGLVYHYGQNDIQPQQIESVSVGDVIRFAYKLYVVQPIGFQELSAVDLADYLAMSPRDRCFSPIARPSNQRN